MAHVAGNGKNVNTLNRANAETGYQNAIVGDTGNIAQMQDTLGQQQGQLAQGALSTEEQAAQTPSFLDSLGNGLISAGASFAGGYGGSMGKK